MKRLCSLLLFSLCVIGCEKFDDSALWKAINENASKIVELEKKVDALNTDVANLKTIVEALSKNEYITTVSELADGSGYSIVFSSGRSIVIKHGKDGSAPSIGVETDTDGKYYWTVNGQWMKDGDGNKVPAQGNDGVTPKFKIEEDYWYISYDDGTSWIKMGKAKGDDGYCMFKDVKVCDGYVIFTLNDQTGTQLKLPLLSGTELSVNVTIPGTISTLISDDQRGTIRKLHVSGKINSEDTRFIINKIQMLSYLDLADSKYEDSDGYLSRFSTDNGSIDTLYLPDADEQYTINGMAGLFSIIVPHPALKFRMSSLHSLKNVIFQEGLTDISSIISTGNVNLDLSISFPTTTTAISNSQVFYDMDDRGISYVVKASTPPAVTDPNGFISEYYYVGSTESPVYGPFQSPLFVPSESIDLYRNANGWKQFLNIFPIGKDIEDIVLFNDPVFKAYCIENFDTDKDGYLSKTEAAAVTTINISGTSETPNATSKLGGIGYFTKLKYLECRYTQISDLEFTQQNELKRVICSDNQKLESLSFFSCTKLNYIDCSNSSKLNVVLDDLAALDTLICENNSYCGNIWNCNNIKYLSASNTSMDGSIIDQNQALEYLCCSGCRLWSLNVSNNTALKYLDCGNNNLNSLDVSNNLSLETLKTKSNPSLSEIWLKTGQTITDFQYDSDISTIKYKD